MRRRHTASLDAGGSTTCVELVEVGPVTPPDEIVKRLQLESGEQALIRRRRMYANGEPMQLATSNRRSDQMG